MSDRLAGRRIVQPTNRRSLLLPQRSRLPRLFPRIPTEIAHTGHRAPHARFGSLLRYCRQRFASRPRRYIRPARTDFTGSLSTKRKRAGPGQEQIRGGEQYSIQEITTRNRLVQTEPLIEIGTLTHREVPFSLSCCLEERPRGKPRSGQELVSYCFASLLYGTLRRVERFRLLSMRSGI